MMICRTTSTHSYEIGQLISSIFSSSTHAKPLQTRRLTTVFSRCLWGNLNRKQLVLDFSNERGQTPLMLLSRGPFLDQIQILLKRGVNVNSVDKNGETSVFYSLGEEKSFGEKLGLFIDCGLNLNTLNVNKVG